MQPIPCWELYSQIFPKKIPVENYLPAPVRRAEAADFDNKSKLIKNVSIGSKCPDNGFHSSFIDLL